MTPTEAFFTVHHDLPREGPGLPEDVEWALEVAGTPAKARILDAACGPGADTVTLAEMRPESEVLAVDLHEPFVQQTRETTARFGSRVRTEVNSYLNVEGPFDLIWCAGAVYFEGIENTLASWLPDLAIGGRVAFSEPVYVTNPPSAEARAFWNPFEPAVSVPEMERQLGEAGWNVVGRRLLIGAAWKAYYDPMHARLDMLPSKGPDEALRDAISEAAEEIALWQACPDEIAYAHFVVEPE